MLDELQELVLQVSNLIPFILFRCEGYFKGSPVLTYTYLVCLKVVLWFALAIYDLFAFMVYWVEAYSDSCQTSKMELFATLINN